MSSVVALSGAFVKRLDTFAPLDVESTAPGDLRAALGIAVIGASGRLGQRIAALASQDPRVSLVAAITSRDSDARLLEISGFSAVIDASTEQGTHRAIGLAARVGRPLLVATTGLGGATIRSLEGLAEQVPVMVAPNLSRGVAILRRLVREAAVLTGDAWDLDLVERHHRRKRDAPSGTARQLVEVVRAAAGSDRLEGRVHSIRSGDDVGTHELRLANGEEELVLSHRALSRDAFARGAIEAALWLARQPAGMHSFDRCLEPAAPEIELVSRARDRAH